MTGNKLELIDIIKWIRNETFCGLGAAKSGLYQLIEALKHNPHKMYMDGPQQILHVDWVDAPSSKNLYIVTTAYRDMWDTSCTILYGEHEYYSYIIDLMWIDSSEEYLLYLLSLTDNELMTKVNNEWDDYCDTADEPFIQVTEPRTNSYKYKEPNTPEHIRKIIENWLLDNGN